MKKIFAFDLDGTLLQTNGKIHPETIEALDKIKAAGHYVAIATGRGKMSTLPFLEQWSGFDFMVCNNGTLVYFVKEDQIYINNSIDKKYLNLILNEAKESQSLFTLSTDKNVYPFKVKNAEYSWLSNQELMDYDAQGFKTEKEIHDAAFHKGEVITQLALRNSQEKIQELGKKYQELLKDQIACFITNRVYLDFNPLGSDKYNGIKLVLDKLNMTNDNLVTFGDSGNDILMLKEAKHSFALLNGTISAKESAKEVIGDHNTSAIAETLLSFLK